MLTQEENEQFTRVGPGTPMGNLLRRYWHPVGCSELVTSKPQRVKVLGEELVLYRGASGQPVLMQLRCAHRNVALDHGRVEGDAIRCPYHGWLYNSAGRCVAQPAEPDADEYKEEFSLRSYPTQEESGLVFAYMGPSPAPVLPLYDVLRMTGGYTQIRAEKMQANWLQAAENILDVAHFSWLHGHSFPFFGGRRTAYRFERTDYGIELSLGLDGGPLTDINPYIFPAINRFKMPTEPGKPPMQVIVYRVPSDDTSHTYYFVGFCENKELADGERVVHTFSHEPPTGVYKHMEEDWWGVDLADQDRMALEQQGAIADRTREHLVASDVGIVRMRRIMREALEAVDKGEDPIGVIRDPAKREVDFELTYGTSITDVDDGNEPRIDYSTVVFDHA